MLRSNSMNILFYISAIAAGIYISLMLLLFVFQSSLIYFPDNRIISTPHEIGLKFDAIDFRSMDGVELFGWFIPGDSDVVVLFCHGNAGNISNRLDSLRIFNRLGLNTFIFDYRGYGKSKGRATEQGTYRDAGAAWNYLVKEKSFPEDRIIIFGRSLGGAIAAHLAMTKQPAALILESTFSSIPDLGAELYPLFPVRLLSRFRYATAEFVRRVHCPVLVMHSPGDDIVPYDLGVQVYQAANESKEFLQMSGDHNNGFLISGDTYLDGMRSFINKYVQE